MARSNASRNGKEIALDDESGGLRSLIARNPGVVGGSTAFIVALSYVASNALWYQPHQHANALFATRPFAARDHGAAIADEPETTINIVRPAEPLGTLADPATRQAQVALQALGLYEGVIDGVAGPATRAAVDAYRRSSGLPAGGIDGELLARLSGAGASAPVANETTASTAPANGPIGDADIRKIQAGLRAFGNDGIEIDGVSGARTRAAIREFQSLFRLAATGEADRAVLAKMQEIGLVE